MNGIKVWKKNDGETQPELILDSPSAAVEPSEKPVVDYLEFWACIQPKLGLETADRILAEMREN
ncbi:MAG: hypothetical protein LH618_05450, partial [Saprospiraceae bacterium]|nr:hypothetical protein [Saprospiraceae bacterium]